MHCRRRTSLLLGYFQLLKGIVPKGSSVSTPNHFATAGVSLSRPLSTARRRLPPPATRCPGGRRAPRPGPAPRPTSSRRTASRCSAPPAPRLPGYQHDAPPAPSRASRCGGGGGGGEAQAAAGMRDSVRVRECRALAAFGAVTSPPPPPPGCGPPSPPPAVLGARCSCAHRGGPRPARSTAPAAAASGPVPGTKLGTVLQPQPNNCKRKLNREPKRLPRMAAARYGCSSLSLLISVAAHVSVVIATLPRAPESIIPDVGSGASCVRQELCRQSGTPALI